MYTAEPGPSISQNNAKSCIQALLKIREQNPVNKSSNNFSQDPAYFNNDNISVSSDVTVLGGSASQDFEQPPSYYKYTETNLPENLDNQNDFNYSQKLFHIADGNLYSIFSPIQGRSYGMKPSFLRKQKYTVQECHSRGRKNLRKGLKFHNFLPSESVTSEKDNGYLRTKWKVHSECRLREEHGTKQITISNWSQSVQNSPNDPVNKPPFVKPNSSTMRSRTESTSNLSTLQKIPRSRPTNSNEIPNGNVDPYDFSLQSSNSFENVATFSKNLNEPTSSSTVSRSRDSARSATSKKGSLNLVLNSLLDKPEASENRNNSCDGMENPSKSPSQSQKHRRKPVQTRRVVPYVKYLSILEENDGVPLDLSAKCLPESSVSLQTIGEELKNISEESWEKNFNSLTNGATLLQSHNDVTSGSRASSTYMISNSPSDNPFQNSSALGSLLQNQIQTPLMFLSPSVSGTNVRQPFLEMGGKFQQDMGNINGKLSLALNAKQIKNSLASPDMNIAHSSMNNMPFSVHKSLMKESQSRTRRRNQRSVIKQKLEDTFKQNGFLVKTKQVSDGEATFCKFRQLRKYTRYYLKSWQQHLPDEVNKMWKGFLPPKTVLPPSSGCTEPASGTP